VTPPLLPPPPLLLLLLLLALLLASPASAVPGTATAPRPSMKRRQPAPSQSDLHAPST
jgi:hypothetical protein